MTDAITQMLDREAIRRVLECYCRGIDRLDIALVDSVYWEDSTDDHGAWKGPGKDFAAFAIPLLRQTYQSTLHMLGQSLIEVDGADAKSETYVIAYHHGRSADRPTLDSFAGRYVDRLQQRRGEWRLSHRTVVIEWNHSIADLGHATYNPADFAQGRRDRSDIAYASHQNG